MEIDALACQQWQVKRRSLKQEPNSRYGLSIHVFVSGNGTWRGRWRWVTARDRRCALRENDGCPIHHVAFTHNSRMVDVGRSATARDRIARYAGITVAICATLHAFTVQVGGMHRAWRATRRRRMRAQSISSHSEARRVRTRMRPLAMASSMMPIRVSARNDGIPREGRKSR